MKLNIVIATGIFPPQAGGPALYAKKLLDIWSGQGHSVTLKRFDFENSLPTGIRHLYYFFRILPAVAKADFVMITDTFSAAVPAVLAGKIFGTPTVIRTGGDFLWESFVERTKKKVLLVDFYKTSTKEFSLLEKIRFHLIRWSLKHVTILTFSTQWQKDIFFGPYELAKRGPMYVVENFYGKAKPTSYDATNGKKIIYSVSRPLVWKNNDVLREAVALAKKTVPEYELVETPMPHKEAMELMDKSYLVALLSLGDISSNMILETIRAGKPFIFTRENGLTDRIAPCSIFVDPLNAEETAEKLVWLADPKNYEEQKKKVEAFSFTRSWDEIAADFMRICLEATKKHGKQ